MINFGKKGSIIHDTTSHNDQNDQEAPNIPSPAGGLPVRTDLRAGLAWDDLDDQAKNLWNQLSSAVSNAVSNVNDAISG